MRTFVGWGVAVGALAALSGCPDRDKGGDAGVPDAGPAQLAEKEPNGSLQTAMPIKGSSVVSAGISVDPARADEDWYVLTAEAGKPQAVDVSVSGIPGADLVLELYDQDGNALVQVNSEGVGKGERIPNVGVKDRLWVKVASAKKGSGGAYSLTALFADTQPGFEVEPNDRAVDANVLPLGQAISGYLGHAADVDWFRIELPGAQGAAPPPGPAPAPAMEDGGAEAPGDAGASGDGGAVAPVESKSVALRIEVTGVPGVKLEVQVLSAAEATLFDTKGKDDEGLSLRNIGVRESDQVLYVVVKSAWMGTAGKDLRRGFSSDHNYTLTVALEEAGANAELEPNVVLDKATPLPSQGGYREGFLAPKTDVDYYVLKADQPALANVQLSGVERVDLMLSVVAPPEAETGPEKVLLRANDGALKEPEQLNNLFCPSACYLKVEGAAKKVEGKWVKDYENAETPYRLTVTTRPDVGAEEREPNNAPGQATPVALGRPIRGTVHPKKDVDYYRLDLTGRPVRTALRLTLLGILKVDVGLYLHREDDDGKLALVQTADRAKGDKPEVINYSAEPGMYVIEVRDSKNRESNFQDQYQLTVEEAN
ncbi:MAG TPA: ABC transporter substrate-binding protein [Myxococcales bacterium]|nr:ABC transporter substrate-binding protein [Myxococcales bacterium]